MEKLRIRRIIISVGLFLLVLLTGMCHYNFSVITTVSSMNSLIFIQVKDNQKEKIT